MEKKKSAEVLATILCFSVLVIMVAGDDAIAGKCAPEFQKVTQCLPFATGKAAAPSKDCCDSATELKDKNPACLCFIIQQIHNSSNDAVKSMGVQESRLLQLPTACKLANASVSECPKLLNLPANSPDAAIFTTNTTGATPVATPGGASASSTTGSDGYWQKPQIAGYLITAMAVFLHAVPTWVIVQS